MTVSNFFAELPKTDLKEEIFETVLNHDHFRVERIISDGQSTPPGEWQDQVTDEWVILLRGSAAMYFEGDSEKLIMRPGDYILIPAHRRHRIEWTDKEKKTVWLALHYV